MPTKNNQKAIEAGRIAFLAGARGGKFKAAPESEQWPDGWIDGIPVEVVQAFEPVLDEKRKNGSATKRAKVQAERMARKIEERTGKPAAFGSRMGLPFAIPMYGDQLIPIDPRPRRLAEWVGPAVQKKIAKRYGPAEKAILLVDLDWPFPLRESDLIEIGQALKVWGSKFREVWIVNAYGDPPQRVPTL